jgi:hypothetical protein
MLETILSGLGSGFIGTALTTVVGYFQQKQKNKHDLELRNLDLKERELEAKLQIEVNAAQIDGEIAVAEAKSYGEILKQADKKHISNRAIERLFDSNWTMPIGVLLVFLLGVLDIFKGFIRPGLTTYMVGLTTYVTIIALDVLNKYGEIITAALANDIVNRTFEVVFFLTISFTTWWFGDRRVAKQLYRLNDGNLREK